MIFLGFFLGAIVLAMLLVGALVGVVLFNIVGIAIALSVAAAIGFFFLGGPSLGTTAMIALLIFVLMQRRRPRRQRRRLADVEATATVVPASAPAPKPRTKKALPASADPTLDLAFTALGDHADWARSRLAVARESCRLFLVLADRYPFDTDAGDLAVRIRKRVPEHVGECLATAEAATESERRTLLDAAVFTLEKVGAEAERQRVRLQQPAAATLDIQREHLTRRQEPGPFSLE